MTTDRMIFDKMTLDEMTCYLGTESKERERNVERLIGETLKE